MIVNHLRQSRLWHGLHLFQNGRCRGLFHPQQQERGRPNCCSKSQNHLSNSNCDTSHNGAIYLFCTSTHCKKCQFRGKHCSAQLLDCLLLFSVELTWVPLLHRTIRLFWGLGPQRTLLLTVRSTYRFSSRKTNSMLNLPVSTYRFLFWEKNLWAPSENNQSIVEWDISG